MTEPTPPTHQLDELRRRWEASPSPRRALELAEEYRRLDRREEGLEVLDRALAEHSGHLPTQVAAGRFRMELGRYEEASEVLEAVVERDPTHLVANKLMVRLHLERGQTKAARDRLDLYQLLNASDPEIEDLERRFEEQEADRDEAPGAGQTAAAPGPLTVEVVPPADGGPTDEATAAAASTGEETVSAEPADDRSARAPEPSPAAAAPADSTPDGGGDEEPAARPAGELFPLPPAAAPELDWAALDAPRPTNGGALGSSPVVLADPGHEPFEGLWRGGDEADFWRSLADEGLFQVAVPEAETAPAAPPEPTVPEADPEPAEPMPIAEPDEPAPAEPAATAEPAEAAAEVVPEVPTAAEPEEDPATAEGAAATTTLADLYLEQGHVDDAAHTLRQVLERDPGDAAARSRLEEIGQTGRELSAGELLAGVDPAASTRERRIQMLDNYLARLRSGRPEAST